MRKETTVTGASGAAEINVNGPIYAVRIEYTSQAAGTDVVVSDPLGGPILTATDTNVSKTYYPRVAASKPDGSASTIAEVCPVAEKVDVTVAQGQANGSVRVIIFRA